MITLVTETLTAAPLAYSKIKYNNSVKLIIMNVLLNLDVYRSCCCKGKKKNFVVQKL